MGCGNGNGTAEANELKHKARSLAFLPDSSKIVSGYYDTEQYIV
jgi:hypothetical protein